MGYAVAAAVREKVGFLVREAAAAPYGSAAEEMDPERVDPDLADELGDEIVTLAAHIHVAIHRMLVLLARYDRLRTWELSGQRSCAHWFSFRTGYDLGTAREYVRAARALEGLPRTSEAMSRGRLSFSQVRALTRVAKAETEQDLLELAEGATIAQLERVVRSWRRGSPEEEAEWERRRHRSRKLSVFPDEDGMYVVQGRLDPEVGTLLMRAVEAASDALFRERSPEAVADPEREAARRRADALGLLAERALAAGFGGGEKEKEAAGKERAGAEDASGAEPEAEAEAEGPEEGAGCGCAASGAPISGTRAERYQVMLHVERATLSANGEPGRSELEDGTRLSHETSRRLSCDAGVVAVTHAPDGSILDVGRRTRTIPPAVRRALEVRDRGCRFPGCGLRFTDAHHVRHWADGGKSSLDNLLLLCRTHHRLLHEGGWEVHWVMAGKPIFLDPRGQGHYDGRWKPPELPEDPVAELVEKNRLRGAEPDAWTPSARWKRERDIPDEVLFRAMEAAL